jgi:hypothetical protein
MNHYIVMQDHGLRTKILSDFGGEIEESYLLVCHFCLPKTSIYVHLVLPEAALPPGTRTAEPLRTGEYNQHV